jgi:hypothetical protein
VNAITHPSAPVAAPCGCGCDDAAGCTCSDPLGRERTRFFPRMLIGPDELTQDQTWIRDRLRRHNRLLHGWGLVCGCDVTQATDANGRPVPWKVCVEPGDVLGPCGDDIVVDCAAIFDVRTQMHGAAGPCSPPADPWCVDVRADRRPAQTYYLAIRYDEHLTRPVRTLAGCGCGCDEAECDYSRIRESFALGVLDTLPASYDEGRVAVAGAYGAEVGLSAATGLGRLAGALLCSPDLRDGVRGCPPCPTDPWVILADFTVDDQGMLTIDPIRHRRYVVSFGAYFLMCGAPDRAPGGIRKELTPSIRKLFGSHIDAKAMRAVETAGDAQAVTALEATAIKGVSPSSKIGRFVGTRTIGEVAEMDRAAFLAEASAAGLDVAKTGQVWDSANTLVGRLGGG